ncbi:MAG: hypothetical protein IKA87_04960 [Lentisphaeria bacterium]|nr:hypothetical protein [Lentisphaeria bacterium]
MKIKIFAAAGVLLLLCTCFLFWLLRDTDEKKISRTLDELCRIGSKSFRENPALGALKANKADKVFAPRCLFNFRLHMMDGVISPTEIGSRIVRIQAAFKWIKLDFSELEVAINKNQADIFFTGSLHGELKQGGKVEELREITATLERQEDGSWKICRMNIKNILEK